MFILPLDNDGPPSIVVLMGVSGSGKTTIGELLASSLGWLFYEGDAFHPESNIEKMGHGLPLDDQDRKPWLDKLKELISNLTLKGEPAILACSALKRSYRDHLRNDNQAVVFVYLKGQRDLIQNRLERRQPHFMKADMVGSQFQVLEEPKRALIVDIAQKPEMIVAAIKKAFDL